MNPAQIRSMMKAPFHPFVVRTGSGESYSVVHPELFWIDPDGEVLLVKDRTQGVALIDTASVTECVRLPAAEKPKGRKGGRD